MRDSKRYGFDQVLRRVLLMGFAWTLSVAVTRAETAYEAMEAVGAKLGEESLERIVSVHGNPSGWTVSLLDPNSTAQLHEVRVRKSRVIGKEIEPSAGRILTPINLDDLNLDSDAAWKLAARHLQKTIPASRVDCTLSTDVNRNAPVWVLKLPHPARDEATILQISATDGSILTDALPPVAAASDETSFEQRPDSVAPVAQRPTANEPGATVASSADPRMDPDAEANEDRQVPAESFRARSATSRRATRSAPAIVEKVAGKVERKVRSVRRILPF